MKKTTVQEEDVGRRRAGGPDAFTITRPAGEKKREIGREKRKEN